VPDAFGHFVVPGGASFLLVCGFTPIARRVALRTGIMDNPASGKRHDRATPYLGGVALALGCFVAAVLVPGWGKGAYAVAAGAGLVAAIGLLDDLHNLHPVPRLLVEIAAATTAAAAGARVDLFGGAADWVVTVVWIVVLTNSFNLLDNMDGAAATIAAVTSMGLTVAAALQRQVLVSGLSAVISGACLSFLLFNRPPARIFMGDAGSLFLGYLLAVVALELRFPTSIAINGVVAVLLLSGVALFDTTLVVLSRKRAGRPLFTGGTDHFSHRLHRLGIPVGFVACILAAVTAVACTLGLLIGRGVIPAGWAGFAPVVGGVALYALLRMDVYGAALAPTRRDVSTDQVPAPRDAHDLQDLQLPGMREIDPASPA
jgi:UDP-GlcNAc:undecaprenyl-phosphate GlcNAc-1-phosphate transferase